MDPPFSHRGSWLRALLVRHNTFMMSKLKKKHRHKYSSRKDMKIITNPSSIYPIKESGENVNCKFDSKSITCAEPRELSVRPASLVTHLIAVER